MIDRLMFHRDNLVELVERPKLHFIGAHLANGLDLVNPSDSVNLLEIVKRCEVVN